MIKRPRLTSIPTVGGSPQATTAGLSCYFHRLRTRARTHNMLVSPRMDWSRCRSSGWKAPSRRQSNTLKKNII